MRSHSKPYSKRTNSSDSAWPVLLLLLVVVLVLTACVLWFMNRAVKNERLAVRQKLADAYRGHLLAAQERLENHWIETGFALDALAQSKPAPIAFQQAAHARLADSILCFDEENRLLYPHSLAGDTHKPDLPDPDWRRVMELEQSDPSAAAAEYKSIAGQAEDIDWAARAWQAHARCLARTGETAAAVRVLTGILGAERFGSARDSRGRLISPSAALMALELMKDAAGYEPVLNGLLNRLNNYEGPPMPASQRRFLMHAVQARFPHKAAFPLLPAEDLAARWIESGTAPPREAPSSGMQPTRLPGVWSFTSPKGRVAALYFSESLAKRLESVLTMAAVLGDARIIAIPPAETAGEFFLSSPAGSSLPGWRLGLELKEGGFFETAASQQIASYLWTGLLVVAAMSGLALVAGRAVRRQVELTQLKNDLVATVSHELKTPLSSMRLLVDTLLDSGSHDGQTTREYLELIRAENLRLSRLIENFLTFSRMEQNKHSFNFRPVPAGEIVRKTAEAARERWQIPAARFEQQIASGLPHVAADEGALVSALLNLLDNAYKYSGEDRRIVLRASAGHGHVLFEVEDNGIGLTPRETKKVFRRFYQVEQRLSRSAGGCGLGLSIVQYIIEAHHGTVQVESEAGRGSTFRVAIPVAPAMDPAEGD